MHDILVIGGGINGAGIARDAAGRGLDVVLCEKDDLAQHTSSASTKLIHGGLRYLEMYDFGLVRKALKEREVLLRAAPHIIWPLRFVLPHHSALRPAWLIRLGLFLYDHLGGRKMLPPTRVLRRGRSGKFDALKDEFRLAFEYSDCWVEDSRLVVLNAMDARERGASILTRTACTGLARHTGHWVATLQDEQGEKFLEARTVVNAAGGWVDDLLDLARPGNQTHLRLVKGSHIIVPRCHEGDHAYFFQNGDGRIIFAIPYEAGAYTLIGTTDIPYTGDRDVVQISEEEVQYLCEAASAYYKNPVRPSDVISTYSGVRPLYDDHTADASRVTRDYVLDLDTEGGAPILSVFGGKITTYRGLAEHVLHELRSFFPSLGPAWTKETPLPGGEIPGADFEDFLRGLISTYPWLEAGHITRLARAYGSRVHAVLSGATGMADLGRCFGGDLYECEVAYLIAEEFAATAEDVLWRRSKTGLHLPGRAAQGLHDWFAENAGKPMTQRNPPS